MFNTRQIIILLFILLKPCVLIFAQNDTIYIEQKKDKLLKQSIIPVVLISGGALLSNSELEKNFQVYVRNQVGNDFRSKIDNYLQYMPAAEMYVVDIMGVEAKNHWFDQTKYLIISQVISSSLTSFLKKATGKERPNGEDNRSFPSGHTTFAFTNAGVLYHEFKDTSPVLVFTGFLTATTTGGFRIANNKHWLSDVLTGAGIGLLTTELVYYFKPFEKFNPFKKTEGVTLFPYKDKENVGFYFSYKF